MYIGLDLATRLSGWCAGRGSGVPATGAFKWDAVEDDVGLLAALAYDDLSKLFALYRPTVVGFEAPILVTKGDGKRRYGDTAAKLQKLYAPSIITRLICHDEKIEVVKVSVQAGKRLLTGNPGAEKAHSVAAAEALGIVLPKLNSDGREDAADASGVWLGVLKAKAPREVYQHWAAEAARIRGAML